MANSKRQCANCKKSKRAETMYINGVQAFCSKESYIDYCGKNSGKLTKKGNKIRVKKTSADLLELNKKSLSWQHKQTQPVFNKMRVLEELYWFYSRKLEPICISCEKPLGNDVWCCGHLKTVGSHSTLRYDERNTFLQCNRYCNMALSGNINGNKNTVGYIQGLKNRFGELAASEIIKHCESTTESVKWTCDQLEELRAQCNKRIRELKPIVERLTA